MSNILEPLEFMGAVALITRFSFRESTESYKALSFFWRSIISFTLRSIVFIFTFQEALPIPFNTDSYGQFFFA